jgi:hypothetical protein
MSSLTRLTLIACLLLMCAVGVSAQGDMYRLPNKKAGSQRQPPAAVATALTNESVLSLVEAELADEVIIRKMRASQCRFDVSPDAIADLKAQGVSKLVLEEMINLSTPPPAIPAAERASSPIRAKFYVAPMPDGFDGFVSAEILKRNLPITVVADERAADFIITGGTNKGVHKWYDTVFGSGYERDRNQGNIRVIRVKDQTVVWAGEAGDRSLWWGALKKGGQRKVADRIVGKMNSQFIKKSR